MPENILSPETKTHILKELLSSKEFSHSQKYNDLLHFLVDASINEEQLKATTLAIKFFGKDAAFDSSIDSTVRSYISNLRKKLEYHYLTAGKSDKYRVIIPIGDYNLKFEENVVINTQVRKKSLDYIYLALIATLLIIISILVYKNYSDNPSNKFAAFESPIWKSFEGSKLKTLFVIGDYYFIGNPLSEKRRIFWRDIQINSEEDLDVYLDQNPELHSKIRKTHNSFLSPHVSFALSTILPMFTLKNLPFEVKIASDLRLEDLQNNNIIYIGSHKNMYLLKRFMQNLNFKYDIIPGGINFHELKSNTNFHYLSIDEDYENLARVDYPMVIKQTGPKNNLFLFFISIHDIGNISTIKYFTDPKALDGFVKKLQNNNFEALFETRGYRREDFSIRLLHLNMLSKELDLPLK